MIRTGDVIVGPLVARRFDANDREVESNGFCLEVLSKRRRARRALGARRKVPPLGPAGPAKGVGRRDGCMGGPQTPISGMYGEWGALEALGPNPRVCVAFSRVHICFAFCANVCVVF